MTILRNRIIRKYHLSIPTINKVTVIADFCQTNKLTSLKRYSKTLFQSSERNSIGSLMKSSKCSPFFPIASNCSAGILLLSSFLGSSSFESLLNVDIAAWDCTCSDSCHVKFYAYCRLPLTFSLYASIFFIYKAAACWLSGSDAFGYKRSWGKKTLNTFTNSYIGLHFWLITSKQTLPDLINSSIF